MTVRTRTRLRADAETIWDRLLFYEHIDRRPPVLLRLLLPTPVRTDGRIPAIGTEARCVYDTGHLVKRATRVDRPRRYGFRVVEQHLAIRGGVRLEGGEYELEDLLDGTTRIGLLTRYTSPRRPRWLWRPLEAAACHAFHRYVLGALRESLERSARSGYIACPSCPDQPAFHRSRRKKCPETGKLP